MAYTSEQLRAQYERAMDRAAARLAVLESLPDEDPYEDGQVLRISRTFGPPKVYAYAAIRVNGEWWLSGRQYIRYGTNKHERVYSQPVPWLELRQWLVDSGDPNHLSIEEMRVDRSIV